MDFLDKDSCVMRNSGEVVLIPAVWPTEPIPLRAKYTDSHTHTVSLTCYRYRRGEGGGGLCTYMTCNITRFYLAIYIALLPGPHFAFRCLDSR